jgi:hypothetical protein
MEDQQHQKKQPSSSSSEEPPSSDGATAPTSSSSSNVVDPAIDAKERLQRFDLVIQHLHRLRATFALDSSVREFQKLHTLTLLGQSLLAPGGHRLPGHHGHGGHGLFPPLPPPPGYQGPPPHQHQHQHGHHPPNLTLRPPASILQPQRMPYFDPREWTPPNTKSPAR